MVFCECFGQMGMNLVFPDSLQVAAIARKNSVDKIIRKCILPEGFSTPVYRYAAERISAML